jgi:hypothetical protein
MLHSAVWVRYASLGLLALGVAGCAGNAVRPGGYQSFATHHYSPPPGPPSDPWGPYIREASTRFRVPEKWIRAVMRQESGGQEDITSSAGAMGLMQVMPATYAQLAAQYGLGNDPYEPHDNMMAGTAYLRQMYDRFGSPGFLAAYNAGPGRMGAYVAGVGDLPDETVNYVAAISPHLGGDIAPSGPLAGPLASARRYAGGCDPNAAYDPSRPCAPAPMVVAAAPVMRPAPILINAPPCDPDAAYDPTRTCRDVPSPIGGSALASAAPPCDPNAAYDPRRLCRMLPQPPDPPPVLQMATAIIPPPPLAPHPAENTGIWAIEVGIYPHATTANDVAAAARASLPDVLGDARITVAPTAPFGGAPLYRARLTALSLLAARTACGKLSARGLGCSLVLAGR